MPSGGFARSNSSNDLRNGTKAKFAPKGEEEEESKAS